MNIQRHIQADDGLPTWFWILMAGPLLPLYMGVKLAEAILMTIEDLRRHKK